MILFFGVGGTERSRNSRSTDFIPSVLTLRLNESRLGIGDYDREDSGDVVGGVRGASIGGGMCKQRNRVKDTLLVNCWDATNCTRSGRLRRDMAELFVLFYQES